MLSNRQPKQPQALQGLAGIMPTDLDRGTGPARGAKRGGLTDHIAGVHLIPNVGREAMVPAECVRRTPRAKPKPAQPQKPKPQVHHAKKHHGHQRRRSRSRDARGRSSSSSPVRESLREKEERERAEDRLLQKKEEEERRRRKALEEETERRYEQEQQKLKELEEIRQKKEQRNSERKKKLGGLFALTEDDIDAEEDDKAQKARIAAEKLRAEKKLAERSSSVPSRVGYNDAQDAPMNHGMMVLEAGASTGNLTAADLDGRMHDHKFSKVWADWDANKKSDPGEIARQFMKIASIKRRGYNTGAPSRMPANRSRSRSRSRSRGRRR